MRYGLNRESKQNNLYIYIFILWYSAEIIYNSTVRNIGGVSFAKISDVITWIVFVFLMFKIIFLQTYTKKQIACIVFITIPVIIATVLSGQRTMMSVWMFVVASKDIDIEKVICTAYKVLLIMLPMIIMLCLGGVIENKTLFRADIQRYSLGFSHPNQLGLRVYQLVACHCYIHQNKLKKINYIYIFLSVLFLIIIPNSQTAYITTAFFLIILIPYKYMQDQKALFIKIYESVIYWGAVCLNLFSIVFSYIDVNRNFILSKIDSWLSARFAVCHKVWLLYGVSFWGQKIYVTEDERKLIGIKNRLWLDNSYVSILLRYGIFVFLIFSIGYLCLIRTALLQKEYMLAIILFLYALYGVMENGLYMITHNIFLIAFSELLYRKPARNNRLLE